MFPSSALAKAGDGAPEVIFGALEKAPHIKKIWADSGYRGKKLASAPKKLVL